MAQRARGVAGGRPADRSRASGRTAGRTEAYEDHGPPALRPQELAALRARLRTLVEPVVTDEGLDFEDVSVSRAGRRYVVRITVDADSGINHDELSDVSRAISARLDEAEQSAGDLTPGAYTLELSSPGIDRPLTLPRHWRRNQGRLVAVRVGGRQVTGRIVAVSAAGVSLDVNGKRLDSAFAELGPGRVQVEFARVAELTDEEIGPEIIDGDDAASDNAVGDGAEPRNDVEDES
jgi:ribosome maturation factor RimP